MEQSNQKGLENLKQKISDFIVENTPKKARFATGLGWSLWERFNLSLEEAELFIADKSIYNYFILKCGTWQSYNTLVINSVSLYPELSSIILTSEQGSHLYKLKTHIINMGLYIAPLPQAELIDDPEAIIAAIRIMAADDAKIFLSNTNDRIRLEAYNKVGYLACAEQMAKDKSSKIRAIICQHLPCGDKSFELMMNDRSKLVFGAVLRKIDIGHIPMMLGSKHLAEKSVRDILNRRINK